jgi:iron complex transport system ATP-binding protein
MKQYDLVGKGLRLLFQDNILAVQSDNPLTTVSSAFYNGGFQTTKVILNAQVPEDYNDRILHDDPEKFIQQYFNKLNLNTEENKCVGMITFAVVGAFSLVSLQEGDLAVSVVVTAGCTHAESAGEKIQTQPAAGTINIIAIIDGNPTESCMVSSIITATEAKTSALKELDVRSLFSGEQATGTPTDAIVIAKTGRGAEIAYSGPSSPLGQLVAMCTKKAVKEAVVKAPIGGYPPGRTVKERLAERHLAVEKLAAELSKCMDKEKQAIVTALDELLGEDEVFGLAVLAAADLSKEFSQNRLPDGFDAES